MTSGLGGTKSGEIPVFPAQVMPKPFPAGTLSTLCHTGSTLCAQTSTDAGSGVILPPSSSFSAHIPPTAIPLSQRTPPHSRNLSDRAANSGGQVSLALPIHPAKKSYFQLQPFLWKNAAPSAEAPRWGLEGGLGSQAGPTTPLNQRGHA